MDFTNEGLSESDTRAKLITPTLLERGWKEDMIRREQTAGAIIKYGDIARRDRNKRVDYVLRVFVENERQPVAVALIEAKKNTDSPLAGMEQVKQYARRMNVPFVYSSNGYRFAEYDTLEGKQSPLQQMTMFPTPEMLRQRYENAVGFNLSDKIAKPLSTPYINGDSERRYYQDAAIRAALEKIVYKTKIGEKPRILLSLATGAGKTFIAAHLLKRIFDAGGMRRALFLCDRDALRQQALAKFQDIFGNDAEIACRDSGGNRAQNARIHIATYQTLGISGDGDDDTNFADEFYPPGHFSHIIVDECHRSLRDGWAKVLQDNEDAVHIGLTATPRQVHNESEDDRKISARNIQYFGDSVYTYGLAQGAEDGYLARCEVYKSKVNIDITGLSADEIKKHKPVDFRTGKLLAEEEIQDMYERNDYENIIMLPDRVNAMCDDLFANLSAQGDPKQKTIVYCVRQEHAEMVAARLNSLYTAWRNNKNEAAAEPYAFVCMAASGSERLPDFRNEDRHHFIAVTVDLLTTGVDIPCVRNIVFFRYIRSSVLLQQMIGRGARIDISRNKLSFNVYDYTNATDLMDEEDIKIKIPHSSGSCDSEKDRPSLPPTLMQVDGLDVSIGDEEGFVIVADENGNSIRLSGEEYRAKVARRLLERIKTPDKLRESWIDAEKRAELLESLRSSGCSPEALRQLLKMDDCDNYDVIAESVFGAMRMTRQERAEAFVYKNEKWLSQFSPETAKVLRALTHQFANNGIEELENTNVFDTDAVKKAGGLEALSANDENPTELMHETKRRLFAA